MDFEHLSGVADELINNEKKINILYAFNGTGKTRLSMEYINKINSDGNDKVLYFNAFIEDLFVWNNHDQNTLTDDGFTFEYVSLKLDINSNFFRVIKESGRDTDVIALFQYYTSSKVEPRIDFETGNITFNLPTGDDDAISNIKISRGEESVFMWSIFYVLVEEVIENYNAFESDDIDDIDTSVQYVFIDDPVSSLDDNHIMSVVLDLSKLLKSSESNDLRFVVTTHHPLFYNVLHNEFRTANKFLYKKYENKYELAKLESDSPFAYHLEIKKIIEEAIINEKIQKYHFTLLRNLLEKTSTFLGYKNWSDCIMLENRQAYTRVINLYSHNKHSMDEYKFPTEQEKAMFKFVFEKFVEEYKWNQEVTNE